MEQKEKSSIKNSRSQEYSSFDQEYAPYEGQKSDVEELHSSFDQEYAPAHLGHQRRSNSRPAGSDSPNR